MDKKWAESSLYRRIEMYKRRAALSDFDRFKVKILKKQVTTDLCVLFVFINGFVCTCFML